MICETGNSLICEKEIKPHCFDIASAGYVNLDRSHAGGGDSKECVKSRSAFLSLGHYKPISDKINELIGIFSPSPSIILDAGCGEGYYTVASSKEFLLSNFIGIDISKSAVEHAAKTAKREKINNLSFAVSSIFDIPMENSSIDCITSIFAPCPEDEFARVLKENGVLVIAAAGENHLLGLKKALYENVYLNEARADLPDTSMFRLCEKSKISYRIHLKDQAEISSLFAMTPYFYRTSISDKEKLSSLNCLDTEVDIEFSVYKRNG
ncbi:MAG: methyltransferase domain-containing protein [Clostridia bacterium]|nr:methyltransferase domain-containing protein [Clostridia bacterium]